MHSGYKVLVSLLRLAMFVPNLYLRMAGALWGHKISVSLLKLAMFVPNLYLRMLL